MASTVVGLAATAHVAGGGILPGPELLLALTALTGCAALLLTGRRLSLPVLLAALGSGQFLLHQAFCWFGVETVTVVATGHHQSWVPVALERFHENSAGGVMTAAHVVATAAAALLLAHGENLLWRFWTWWQPLRAVVFASLRLPVVPRVPTLTAVLVPRPSFVVARRVPRRGPPGFSVPVPTTR